MVDAQSVSVQSLDMHISVVLRGTQTGFVRVFQLDAEKKHAVHGCKANCVTGGVKTMIDRQEI